MSDNQGRTDRLEDILDGGLAKLALDPRLPDERPGESDWAAVEARVLAGRRGRRHRRAGVAGAISTLAAAAALAFVVMRTGAISRPSAARIDEGDGSTRYLAAVAPLLRDLLTSQNTAALDEARQRIGIALMLTRLQLDARPDTDARAASTLADVEYALAEFRAGGLTDDMERALAEQTVLGRALLSRVGAAAVDRRTAPVVRSRQSDSAAVYYLEARQALERGDTARAISALDITWMRFRATEYAPRALYWKSFILYRRGDDADLRVARNLLTLDMQFYPDAHAQGDGAALLLRVQALLAGRGDATARRALGTSGDAGSIRCAVDEQSRLVESVGRALDRGTSPLPAVERILETRVPCAALARQQAILLLAGAPSASADSLLVPVAREDPDLGVRQAALTTISRRPGALARSLFEEILDRDTVVTTLETAAAGYAAMRAEWGDAALRRYLRRADRSPVVSEYVAHLLAKRR